jgi:hypothetical protein
MPRACFLRPEPAPCTSINMSRTNQCQKAISQSERGKFSATFLAPMNTRIIVLAIVRVGIRV